MKGIKALALLSICFLIPAANAYVVLNDLNKVDSQPNLKCVEFYMYKNELYCTTMPAKYDPVDARLVMAERQHIEFDNRIWRAAFANKTASDLTIEYIPDGDSINNWKELITSQLFFGMQNTPPAAFAESFMSNLNQKGYQGVVTVYESTPKRHLLEFQIKQPASEVQDVIINVTTGKDGMYVLQYAVKKPDMGQEARKLWLENLKNSTHP